MNAPNGQTRPAPHPRPVWREALRPLLAGLLASLLGGLMSACTTAPMETQEKQALKNPVWPEPPDPPRYIYETTLRSVADITVETESERFKRLALGTRIPTEPVFQKPAGIAARQGKIYVGDTVRRKVVVFDVPRRKVYEFGSRTPGQIAKPIALAVDNKQWVYVADATHRRAMIYDGLGLFLKEIGSDEDLYHPSGIAVSPSGDRIYVVDRGSNDNELHRVQIYDAEGRKLRTIGKRGSKPGEFNIPVDAAVAPDGTLYILDSGNFRVQAFDREGVFLRAFGQLGSSLGQFARPRGIGVDQEGNVYVTDGSFGNCQVFSPAGELLITLGSGGLDNAPGRFRLPIGVTVDETNRVYIADQYFLKVDVIRKLREDEIRTLSRGR